MTGSTAELEWTDRAACKGKPLSLFFGYSDELAPYMHAYIPAAQLREARALCRNCPVRRECATHALDEPEPYGIWGGLTRRERSRLLARRG